MLSLALFRPRPRPQMPSNPWNWGRDTVSNFLGALNPRKSADREEVRRQLRALERAIGALCTKRFPTVESVLRAKPQELPVQLRAYRELYEYMLVWLN